MAAAAQEFATTGYEGTSLRSVAKRAGVDPALVHHHFGSKADLFMETVRIPLRPDRILATVIDGPRETFGHRLIRAILHHWDQPKLQKAGVALLRRALGTKAGSFLLREFLVREVFAKVAQVAEAPDGELRASLMASHVVGVIVARYLLALPPVASADAETLAARIGPVLQHYISGPVDTSGAVFGDVALDEEGP